jgi:hypothetical protein
MKEQMNKKINHEIINIKFCPPTGLGLHPSQLAKCLKKA